MRSVTGACHSTIACSCQRFVHGCIIAFLCNADEQFFAVDKEFIAIATKDI